MTPKRKNNLRSVRIDQDTWDRYQAKARRDHGTAPASVIRALLAAWHDGDIEVQLGPTVTGK